MFRKTLAVLLVIVLCVCLGCGGRGDSNGVIDTSIPLVAITSPTGLSGYSTKSSTINLAGFAYDNKGLNKVWWSNNRGGDGITTGINEWSIPGISLKNGDNVITVTAEDTAGNTGSDLITVTFNPNLDFLSTIQAIPDSIFVDESTLVIFRIGVENNPNLDKSSLELLKVDDYNNVIEVVTNLADDGNVDNGDDIASDGVFSGKATITETTEGIIRLRVSADTIEDSDTTTAYSVVFSYSVITHLTDTEFSEAIIMPDETHQKYDELEATYGEDEAKTKTVEWLINQSEIGEAGISESGNGIWYVLNSGILGGILLNPEGTEGERISSSLKKPLVQQPLNYKSKISDLVGFKRFKEDYSEFTIGSNNALVIAPFNWQWQTWGTDFEEDVYDLLDSSTCPIFSTDKVYDSNATVGVFKNLSDYGIVVLHTHGDSYFSQTLHGIWRSFDDIFATPWGKVVFITGEKVTNASKSTYEADLKKGRIAIISNYYAITPAFISYYNKSFSNSIIYNGSCRGMYNSSMANAFIGSGAKVYFGFSEYVLSVYDRNIALTLFDSLINQGKTTSEAFNDAVATHGNNDGQKKPAYFKIQGSSDMVIKTEGLINGTFEIGNINGWTGQGDVRIISQLGPLSPIEGSYMNIISTGLGSVNDSDSLIEQTFCIPAGITSLSFDYNVVSEEPMEYVGSEYDDKFEATLTTSSGTITIASESINTSSWSSVSDIDFYGGDETTYMTGWKHISYDISGVTDEESITLKFHTWDKGDSIYDTAVLIDNIKLE